MAPVTSLLAPAKAYDPSLTSLFASSSGPVKIPRKSSRQSLEQKAGPEEDEAQGSEADSSPESSSEHDDSASSEAEDDIDADRPRKRRRHDNEGLETSYFRRLAEEEDREQDQQDQDDTKPTSVSAQDQTYTDDTSSYASVSTDSGLAEDAIPVHESLSNGRIAADKSNRTVFLSNVSTVAIKSKSSRKVLLDHLESVLGKDKESDKTMIESFRFRSTAYVADAGPKRAAFAKKELMEQTAHSTNAYAVFSSEEAAKRVATRLNGTIVLDRHLRVDNVANPERVDHQRCVFVGNLPFVDEETPEEKDGDGEVKRRRPRAKQPADAEEGLWRAFSKAGKVENVRVVRDKETRVGKGFAYVQFTNENAVEAALLLDGKRFPPMLPRTLRVSRAKRARAASRPQKRNSHPDGKHGDRFKQFAQRNRRAMPTNGGVSRSSGIGKPSKFVFEGHRASSLSKRDGKPKKRAVRPTNRSAKRGASFKASGGKKKRDRK